MFYLITASIFLFAQTLIIGSANILIYPEFFIYPWLLSKRLLIFRDFLAQHGPFLYLMLVPFVNDRSLLSMKLFYVAVQTLTLILVLAILRKTTGRLGFVLGGVLFIIHNFYIADNHLWDDVIAVNFYMFIYYWLVSKPRLERRHLLIIGLLAGLVSLIKPYYASVIFPAVIVTGSLVPFISFFVVWLAVMVFYAVNHGLWIFLDQFIFYNIYYAFQLKKYQLWVSVTFLKAGVLMLTFGLAGYWFIRNKFKNNPILLFLVFSGLIFFTGFRKVDYVIYTAFFCIFIGQVAGKLTGKKLAAFLIVLFFYLFYSARQAKHIYYTINTFRVPYTERPVVGRMVGRIKRFGLEQKQVYVLGNYPELYYFLEKVPPVWHNMVWPFSSAYYRNTEQEIINDLKKKQVDLVVIPKPLDPNYKDFHRLIKFIYQQYQLIYQDNDFWLYSLKMLTKTVRDRV